jgi:hypothetical protein
MVADQLAISAIASSSVRLHRLGEFIDGLDSLAEVCPSTAVMVDYYYRRFQGRTEVRAAQEALSAAGVHDSLRSLCPSVSPWDQDECGVQAVPNLWLLDNRCQDAWTGYDGQKKLKQTVAEMVRVARLLQPIRVSGLSASVTLRNAVAEEHNAFLPRHKAAINRLDELLQAYGALLPLDELSRYDYRSKGAERSKVQRDLVGKTVVLYPVNDALSLLADGQGLRAMYLLHSIGQVKIAYLGLLLLDTQNDRYAQSQKISIMRSDIVAYYAFLNYLIQEWNIQGTEIPERTQHMLKLWRESKGVFSTRAMEEFEALDEGSAQP